MVEITKVSDKELTSCPTCETTLQHGGVEFLGEGLMVVGVECQSCGWYGSEEWVHDQTVQYE